MRSTEVRRRRHSLRKLGRMTSAMLRYSKSARLMKTPAGSRSLPSSVKSTKVATVASVGSPKLKKACRARRKPVVLRFSISEPRFSSTRSRKARSQASSLMVRMPCSASFSTMLRWSARMFFAACSFLTLSPTRSTATMFTQRMARPSRKAGPSVRYRRMVHTMICTGTSTKKPRNSDTSSTVWQSTALKLMIWPSVYLLRSLEVMSASFRNTTALSEPEAIMLTLVWLFCACCVKMPPITTAPKKQAANP
mmetsp:Transcript_405/g.1049  ORF Transcript_405/g.1049 Transcript_405/m.1049 type:complete len:251 (-) Transcript_405:732-1484(-)